MSLATRSKNITEWRYYQASKIKEDSKSKKNGPLDRNKGQNNFIQYRDRCNSINKGQVEVT